LQWPWKLRRPARQVYDDVPVEADEAIEFYLNNIHTGIWITTVVDPSERAR
jgi:hypothetical protein